jgi:hypothetical protein
MAQSSAIATQAAAATEKEPAMNPHRPQQAAAFVLSLIVSLALFSGVASLAGPEHGGQVLVQTPAAEPAHS